jgi:hypothetical protein
MGSSPPKPGINKLTLNSAPAARQEMVAIGKLRQLRQPGVEARLGLPALPSFHNAPSANAKPAAIASAV